VNNKKGNDPAVAVLAHGVPNRRPTYCCVT